MTKIKMVFRTMSLIVFMGFLSCEKDEITSTELSTTFDPISTENVAKELHDPFANWRVKGPSKFTRNKDQVLEKIDEKPHPAYVNLENELNKKKTVLGICLLNNDLDRLKCPKEEEEYQKAKAAVEDYIAAGLPQVIPGAIFQFIVTREDNNFVYIKDASRGVEIALPVDKPNEFTDARILVNGEYEVWRQALYRESGIITGTINRTTGEYRDIPGRRIKVDYFASPGAPCYEDENLEIRITGDGVRVSVDVDFGGRTATSTQGTRTFIMPASGVVKIRAAINANNGCSTASITFNDANTIALGTGGYGERKFP
ncbi:hypothetical protein [Aquimarina algiphila]|uniref:hypothetical protein n=1 Tax=Aquimarina algiphila TaxID=2047982 RepID=UPI00232CBD8B|nr:hypothetical protein [Aquimarina algiphila]